jgi:hypothetical protein
MIAGLPKRAQSRRQLPVSPDWIQRTGILFPNHLLKEKKMKLLTGVFALVLVFVAVVPAFADLEWADPALCVNGQWLMVDAAANSSIQVQLPHSASFGDQAAGQCTTPAPAPLLPTSQVTVRGNGAVMMVVVDGANASPSVTVSYGAQAGTHSNNGHDMHFGFQLGR